MNSVCNQLVSQPASVLKRLAGVRRRIKLIETLEKIKWGRQRLRSGRVKSFNGAEMLAHIPVRNPPDIGTSEEEEEKINCAHFLSKKSRFWKSIN